VFTDLLGYSPALAAVKLTDRSRLAMGETVTGNYFQLLGVRAAAGRTLLPDDDRPGAPRAVVISYRLWNREYGASPSAVGQSIRIHGQAYTIVGVAPKLFTGMVPLLAPEVWTPMAYVDEVEPGGIMSTVPSPTGNTRLERRGTRWMFVKGRLKADVTFDQAAANMRLIGKQLQAANIQTNKDREVSMLATKDVHLHTMADRTLQPIAFALMLVVGLVLLIACANVASMLLARASGRQKEIGIRLAIGASRRRLVQQLLSESLVMAVLGAAAGVALAWALTQAALSISLPIPIPLSFALRIDGRVLLFTAGVAMLAALVAGLAPALKATRPNLVTELKSDAAGARVGVRRWTLRDGLVVTQIAVTMVLLVSAGLLTRSLSAAQKVGIGFEPEGLAIVSMEMSMLGYNDSRAKSSTTAHWIAFAPSRASRRRRWRDGCRSPSITTATTCFSPTGTGPMTRVCWSTSRVCLRSTSRRSACQSCRGAISRQQTRQTPRAWPSSTRRWRGSTGPIRIRSASDFARRPTPVRSTKSWA
jgi:predicted permease